MNDHGFEKLKSEIIDKGLCTKCGTCMGICPEKCIIFKNEYIQKSVNECISCGQCIRNCPGKGFDYNEYNRQLFGADYDKANILGTYQKIYAGYAVCESVRRQAASGGIVSEIAAYLIKEHNIDGVVVAGPGSSPLEFEVKVAKSVKEVYDAFQSKYTIIPMGKAIRHILDHDGKYAFIGLPCQVQGIRKAVRHNALLSERIVVIIGLFCGFNLDSDATKYLIAKSKIKPKDIQELSYRKKWKMKLGFIFLTVKGRNL